MAKIASTKMVMKPPPNQSPKKPSSLKEFSGRRA